MRDTLNEYLEKFKENSKKHKKMISVFFMLALIVAVGVTWRLKLIGVSMTNEVYCGKEEHIHTADCYRIVEASRVTDDDVIVATSTQTDAISDDGAGGDEVIPEGYVKILVCGKEEHIHTMACMSDETADLETEEYWRDLINVLNLRGESYSEDLLAIADSQIGYSESIRNFEVLDNENSKNGITRYGQWYGNPYGNWNAMFVAFCLNYAGVSSNIIPYNSGVEAWMVDLTKKDLYQNSSVYTPTAGDIAFVDSDGDGTADEVGIVREITYDENDGVTINGISLIQGDVANGFDVNEFDTNESVAADILNEDAKEEKTDCVQIVWYLNEAENDVTSDNRVEGDEVSENETGKKQLSEIIGYVGIPVKESIEASEEFRDDIVDVDNENIQELQYSSSQAKLSDATKNLVTVNKAIAGVTDTYTASRYSVFYDATYSKLSYLGSVYKVSGEDFKRTIYENSSTDKTNYIIPWQNKDIYFHAWNSDTDQQDGTCRLLNQHTSDDGNNVWKDIYVADLNKQYTNIIFYTSDAQGTWPDSGSKKTTSRTGDLTIPWNTISNPCFYADTSDSMIYRMYTAGRNENTCRSGFWDEVYTVRDAEKGKATDIVPIDANSSFSAAANVRYVNSTFYDYYSDFELNGNKRADYGESNGSSHKNWVTFRQFDQALSDYYRDAGTVSSPIYTGHFQPDYSDWTERFSEIAGTLDLYGWSDRNKFLANNNSTLDINGGDGKYSYAAQGLVENSLGNDNKLKNTGGAIEPHFDKEFLEGSNSKNAVIGEVFENVAFPFTEVEAFKDEPGVKYWWFDSASTTVQLKKNKSYATDSSGFEYFLDGSAGSKQNWALNVNSSGTNNGVDSVSNKYGFFPFNNMSGNENGNCGSKYNYGFGTKLEFTFSLGENGMIQSTNGNSYHSRMRFSGDDDVWIYIDGKLALDCGGAHGKVSGMLDFNTLTGYVTDVKDNNEEMYSKLSTPVSVTYTKGGVDGSTEVADLYNYSKTFSIDGDYMDAHTVTIFFMERGMWESNFSLIFASTPPVYKLPNTGGSGTNMLIYSGIAILLLGCLYYRYVFRQFKEERRKV